VAGHLGRLGVPHQLTVTVLVAHLSAETVNVVSRFVDPQIRIRIGIEVISLIRNRIRINLQMTSKNVWNMNLF
jgi:hypothetical protein